MKPISPQATNLLLKCLKVMTKNQKSKVKDLVKWESEYKQTNDFEKKIIYLIKKNKNYSPIDIVDRFPKGKQDRASVVLRSLVMKKKVLVSGSWKLSLRKDNL